MASKLIVRTQDWVESESDPYMELLIAVVRQAWQDLELPIRGRSKKAAMYPTQADRATARWFLADMAESATRRTP